jgi:hypothetical protein
MTERRRARGRSRRGWSAGRGGSRAAEGGAGGRKRVVAPDGSAIVPASKSQPGGTLIKALARAWRWRRMLDEGAHTSVSEIGDAEKISKSYVNRILRLAPLAPDIIEAILAGGADYAARRALRRGEEQKIRLGPH